MEIRAVLKILIAEGGGGEERKEVETEALQTLIDWCNSSLVLRAGC